jgi:DNA-binding MarR family transcriptional regulator
MGPGMNVSVAIHADVPAQSVAAAPVRDASLVQLLGTANHAVARELHLTIERRGITLATWRALATLAGNPEGETVTNLAHACLLQQPTMTKQLDRMERAGLARRIPDQRDRRVVRVFLTARGQALADELLEIARRHEAEVLGRFVGLDVGALKDALGVIVARGAEPIRMDAEA